MCGERRRELAGRLVDEDDALGKINVEAAEAEATRNALSASLFPIHAFFPSLISFLL